ncbi:hypothetical protein GWO43_11375 [candidate division KSB1 bacterium]|nr:hypothetical protein [candidate division KSB1 bacterium]NIR70603.1 hypothetical protein [candidate division KSB1 bacterium]NIS24548.1 hypothetical protein [candidate division KSB1 bacterium]NIT71466.1 hypothetical protein [candidate division KSB1 bacterium]NIU25157.1 hypothetical protein [candidate division KSB1 bacterium]
MAQINLFTPAIIHKEKALTALQRLALKEAQEQLQTAREIDPSLADLEMLTHTVDFLRKVGVHSKTRPPGLVRAWRRLREAKDSTPSRTMYAILETTLCRRILERLPDDYNDYVHPSSGGLHIGYCHLVLQNAEAAHKKLLDYLTAHAEESHPLLWGYFGDAGYLLNRSDESNSGYLRALFMDPQAVDLAMLKQPQIRTIYDELCEQHDDDLARALLPSEAWLQGVLHIPPGNTYLAKFIQRRRFDLSAELLLYPTQRSHQFALCLYVDQSGLHGDIDFNAREEMQRLDGELFRRYLAVLESRPGPQRILERW